MYEVHINWINFEFLPISYIKLFMKGLGSTLKCNNYPFDYKSWNIWNVNINKKYKQKTKKSKTPAYFNCSYC